MLCAMVLFCAATLLAQSTTSVSGTVVDAKGTNVPNATIKLVNDKTSAVRQMNGDAEGRFTAFNLPEGVYTVSASAPNFALTTQKSVNVSASSPTTLTLPLKVGGVSDQIDVETSTSGSIAAQYAPMDGLLDARSARTEISSMYIQNFVSPVADYSEIIQNAPGIYSLNANGVGLGDGKSFFRGFKDGQYDVTFDSIPFNDTNDVSHHSWAFFPGQMVGSVDFDRSPGTASTIGPAPFGGSINLLSKEVAPQQSVRGTVSYGSFNTQLYDGVYESSPFGPSKKSNFIADVHRLSSDGYQTYNHQNRVSGSLKYVYKISDKTLLTGFSGVIRLSSNTPDQKGATRAQIAQFGVNFLLNNDPTSPLYYRYNSYNVPTDFEYVGIQSQLGHGFNIDVKPYTYSYNNQQFFASTGAITATSGTDKVNSYRKYGETGTVSKVSRFGIFRAGLWYEWAATDRYQVPTSPVTHLDAAMPSFHEKFWTNSYQPFAEYEYRITRALTVTGGIKFAHYTQDIKQYADNGKVIGTPASGAAFITRNGSYTSYLPSFDVNYKLKPNWSIYSQYSTGSIIPPSNVYDVSSKYALSAITAPKPTTAWVYQGGSVLKLKRITLNADAYYVHFGNTYSASPNPNVVNYTSTGDSVSKGFEGEANLYLGRGLSIYGNGTAGSARYASAIVGGAANPNLGLWVASTPANTEDIGFTYQRRFLDFGFFNKRVGPRWADASAPTVANPLLGATSNQVIPIDPFNISNLYFNYTIRKGSLFDQSKIRLSFNNLFDQHTITTVTQAAKATVYTPGPTDVLALLPGRSVTISFTFAITKGR